MESEKDLIERFFDQDLNQEEQQAFEQKLQKDPSFAQAFALEQDLMEGIESLGNDKLRKELQQIHQEEVPPRNQPKVRTISTDRRWWLAAALFIGLALAWWLWPGATPDTQQLYAQYMAYDFSVTQKSGAAGIEKKLLRSAEKSFKDKRYQAAFNSLNQYLQMQSNDQESALAKGVALLYLEKDYPSARAIFQDLIDSKSLLANDGYWFMALLNLKLGDTAACQESLRAISSNSARHAKAQDLLAQLN